MSNRTLSPFRIRRLGVAALAACLAAPAVTHAQDGDEPETLPDLTGIKRDLEEIRGLEFLKDVPAERQSTEDFRAYIEADLDANYPTDLFANMIDGLLRLGLVRERFDLEEGFINAILSQAGAYYDPASGKFFYLMTNVDEAVMQEIASHELVHAIQDQHFDLGAVTEELESMMGLDGSPRQDDRVLAVRCLIEGEATYVQTIWQMRELLGQDITRVPAMETLTFKTMANMDLDQIIDLSKKMPAEELGEDIAKAMAEMESIPRYILAPLISAYMQGAYFTMSVRQSDGWEGLNAVYSDMPVSTEQCLHPDKYTGTRDTPTELSLPSFAVLEEGEWSEIDSAIHGEFYLGLLLTELGAPVKDARRAAAGWDGDVYRAYRNDDGKIMFVMATTWDTEKDAVQFFEAYSEILDSKYKDLDVILDDEIVMSYSCGGDLGEGRLVRRGREVFLVEGASKAEAKAVIADLKALEIVHVE